MVIIIYTPAPKSHISAHGYCILQEKKFFSGLAIPAPTSQCSHRQVRKEGTETMTIVFKFRKSCLEVLHKINSPENIGKFSTKHSCWVSVLQKWWNEGLQLN